MNAVSIFTRAKGQQRQRRKRADTSLYTLLGVTPKAHMLPATSALNAA